jgi:flagellar basal body rod protein FlgF
VKIENGIVTNAGGKKIAFVRRDADGWVVVRALDGREATFRPDEPRIQELINRFIYEGGGE